MLRWLAVAYDLVIVAVAIFDAWNSKLPAQVRIERHFGSRFAVGAETEVRIDIANHTPQDLSLVVKDEYPPLMKLTGSREARLNVDAQTAASFSYWLTPPKRGRFEFGLIACGLYRTGVWFGNRRAASMGVRSTRTCGAREAELKALGSFVCRGATQVAWRGEGRDFDRCAITSAATMRHISWTATARRGKLVTRQYQMERDQTI